MPAVRAEGRADGRGSVLHGRRIAVALPLEEMPLPAAPVEWALVEQLLGAADVASGQLALRQGYALDVRSILLTFKGLLRLLSVRCLTCALLAANTTTPLIKLPTATNSRHCSCRAGDKCRFVSPRELAEAVPGRRRAGLHRLVVQIPLDVRRRRRWPIS